MSKDDKQAKEPYGDVEYADPGYQKDGKKRYPLDTAEHVRSAWDYINHPDNASKYEGEHLSKIKAKIIAAWKAKVDKDGPPSAKKNVLRSPDTEVADTVHGYALKLLHAEKLTDDATGLALSDVRGTGTDFKFFEKEGGDSYIATLFFKDEKYGTITFDAENKDLRTWVMYMDPAKVDLLHEKLTAEGIDKALERLIERAGADAKAKEHSEEGLVKRVTDLVIAAFKKASGKDDGADAENDQDEDDKKKFVDSDGGGATDGNGGNAEVPKPSKEDAAQIATYEKQGHASVSKGRHPMGEITALRGMQRNAQGAMGPQYQATARSAGEAADRLEKAHADMMQGEVDQAHADGLGKIKGGNGAGLEISKLRSIADHATQLPHAGAQQVARNARDTADYLDRMMGNQRMSGIGPTGEARSGPGYAADADAHDTGALALLGQDLKGVEIFRSGKWNGDTYTDADLDAIVANFPLVGFQPPIKLGHDESSGDKAYGWVTDVRREGDRLVADFADIPDDVYKLIKDHQFDHVSSEIYWDLNRNDETYDRVLKAVALLGAETPAVSDLAPLRTAVHSVPSSAYNRVTAYTFIPKEWEMDRIEQLTALISELEAKLSAKQAEVIKLNAANDTAKVATASAERDKIETDLKKARGDLVTTTKAFSAKMTSMEEDIKRLTATQMEDAERRRKDLVDRKAKECRIPALRAVLYSLYDLVTSEGGDKPRTVKFTQGDKTEDIDGTALVDALVASVNKQSEHLFRQATAPTGARLASDDDMDGGANGGEDPATAVDRLAKEHMEKSGEKSYRTAVQHVLRKDAKLRADYARFNGSRN